MTRDEGHVACRRRIPQRYAHHGQKLAHVSLSFAVSRFGRCLLCVVRLQQEPACKACKLDPARESASLPALVPKDATVCEGSTPTTAQFWKPVRVHDANIASVGSAQDNGWSRNSDNWYATSGNFDTPKWSELKSAPGSLRIDVKEAGEAVR